MTLSILLKLLHGIEHQDKEILSLLETTQVLAIPVVNPDGLAQIERDWDLDSDNKLIKRKNGRITSADCARAEQGVDINRNFQIFQTDKSLLDTDDADPCSCSFRGPEPFSEPESRTMRDFILDKKSDLKFLLSYHSYGNSLVIPYGSEYDELVLTADQARIYDEIIKEVDFPDGMVAGSPLDVVGYSADGDVADWALHEAGVISMTSELGSEKVFSDTFDLGNTLAEAKVILDNIELPFFLMEKAGVQLALVECDDAKETALLSLSQKPMADCPLVELNTDKKSARVTFNIFNKGMSDVDDAKVTVSLPNELVFKTIDIGSIESRDSKHVAIEFFYNQAVLSEEITEMWLSLCDEEKEKDQEDSQDKVSVIVHDSSDKVLME